MRKKHKLCLIKIRSSSNQRMNTKYVCTLVCKSKNCIEIKLYIICTYVAYEYDPTLTIIALEQN